MLLNLITDPWIPVRTSSGQRNIRPDQIAEPDVLAPDWPRADLNIACLELLIGLVYMADPPDGPEDWEARQVPDPDRLRAALAPLSPAFSLDGDGPRFLQDLEPLDGDPNPLDMLFIDSSGGSTAKNNADLFVRRCRYPALQPAMAAMALYTLQAHAPAGGKGNRTSMRGGGPMVTIVDPHRSLWDLIWANVPYGAPQGADSLPWMHKTRTSEKGQPQVLPGQTNSAPAEIFFGMPRRLRLVFENGLATGVVQRIHGTDYAGWVHPLTPYYQSKAGEELLPKHPRAGGFGYSQWLGVLAAGQTGDLVRRAESLDAYDQRVPASARRRSDLRPSVIVAGWSMDNMKPREFLNAHEPMVNLEREGFLFLRAMVQAAEHFGRALRDALKPVCVADDVKKTTLSVLHERFFTDTENDFLARVLALEHGAAQADVAHGWVKDMRHDALRIFDEQAMPGLADRAVEDAGAVIAARSRLLAQFAGRMKPGKDAFTALDIEPDAKNKKEAAA